MPQREGRAAKGLPLLFAVNIFGELVAGAGHFLQASAIGDGDVAAAVVDKIARSQGMRRRGDADATHAQHLAQQLVRQRKVIRANAVAGQQQSMRQARLNQVKPIARCRVRDLRHE